jgi:enoyl-CoA hydratase/carnithine racemase
MGHVRIEDVGSVRHVVISRAEKRNALSSDVYAELGEAFAAAARAVDVRCVIVRGDGPIFSAGNDVEELADLTADPAGVRRGRPIMLSAVNAVEEMTKPTVAQQSRVHGYDGVLFGQCVSDDGALAENIIRAGGMVVLVEYSAQTFV